MMSLVLNNRALDYKIDLDYKMCLDYKMGLDYISWKKYMVVLFLLMKPCITYVIDSNNDCDCFVLVLRIDHSD